MNCRRSQKGRHKCRKICLWLLILLLTKTGRGRGRDEYRVESTATARMVDRELDRPVLNNNKHWGEAASALEAGIFQVHQGNKQSSTERNRETPSKNRRLSLLIPYTTVLCCAPGVFLKGICPTVLLYLHIPVTCSLFS